MCSARHDPGSSTAGNVGFISQISTISGDHLLTSSNMPEQNRSRIGEVLARQPERDPVGQHVEVSGLFEDARFMALDRAATEAERARLREQRGPIETFDFGHAPTGGRA